MTARATRPAPLEAEQPEKRRYMKFDPQITMGNILTAGAALVSVSVAWGVLTARMDAADQRAQQQRTEFSQAVADLREAIKEQRGEMRDVQKSINMITTDTALIRGRLASSDNTGARGK